MADFLYKIDERRLNQVKKKQMVKVLFPIVCTRKFHFKGICLGMKI